MRLLKSFAASLAILLAGFSAFAQNRTIRRGSRAAAFRRFQLDTKRVDYRAAWNIREIKALQIHIAVRRACVCVVDGCVGGAVRVCIGVACVADGQIGCSRRIIEDAWDESDSGH
mgnify:CR=1 FL=1